MDGLIKYHWTGKSELISESEQTELKNHCGIGLSQKSHGGGFPVFDKVQCRNAHRIM